MARWALVLLVAGCTTPQERRDACFSGFGHDTTFGDEVELIINGNPGSAMEPRLTPDERFLFWNDKPASDDAMQLHVATRVDAGVYSYVGPLQGANVDGFLDGVPAIDASNRFFFVSLFPDLPPLPPDGSGGVYLEGGQRVWVDASTCQVLASIDG